MKSDDETTRVQKAFWKTKSELDSLGHLLYETVTLKLSWQYYVVGAILWIDGIFAGWLLCSGLF